MDNDLTPKKGCSVLIKLLFFLSVVLNILFLLAAVYIYGVVRSFSADNTVALPGINSGASQTAPADHPLLNSEQEKMLDSLGVDVENLPTEITPELESCFEQTVGVERVEEIKKGSSVIGPLDIMKAKSCL